MKRAVRILIKGILAGYLVTSFLFLSSFFLMLDGYEYDLVIRDNIIKSWKYLELRSMVYGFLNGMLVFSLAYWLGAISRITYDNYRIKKQEIDVKN